MNHKKQAFTLVELIVVITILAILGTIAFISLQGYSANSRDSVRTSDTSNMRTILELFHLNAGKYPIPDDYGTLTFSGNILFYQGYFGEQVIQSTSRNMQEIPTDPLTNLKYIYSISNNKNELEILSLLEGDDFVYNYLVPLSGGVAIIPETNALGIRATVKIIGNYNGLFVKTSTHIVPLPSIINTEATSGTLIPLDSENIKSMVTNLGTNIPNLRGNITTSTGNLNIALSVWTGSLNTKSSNTDKLAVFTAIQVAYTGSSLVNEGIIENLLSKTTEVEQLFVTETVVLNNTTISTPTGFVNCGDNVKGGGKIYTTILGSDGNCWTSQYMRHGTMLVNGSAMPSNDTTIEKWCYDTDNNGTYNTTELNNCENKGGLYTYDEAMGYGSNENENITKSVCGSLLGGWHLPTDTEWTALTNAGATGWSGNKLSGIISFIQGNRTILFGPFSGADSMGSLWSSTESNPTFSLNRIIINGSPAVGNASTIKSEGYSVVCIKN